MLERRVVVLVEDDEIMGASLVQRLELEGAEVQWHRSILRALPAIRTPRKQVDAVVCDIRLPDGSGETLYETLIRTSSPPPFLFITGQGQIDQAVRLMRSGASDYILKPFDTTDFLSRLMLIMRASEGAGMPAESGVSTLARALDRQVADAAKSDTALLLRGGPGLGKLRLARRLHDLSDRRAAPFVALDCLRADVTPTVLADALDAAGEGTLAIVAIGRLPAGGQALLRARLFAANFRLIATAGLRLEERVAAGCFRSDLFDLLQTHEIIVPPLADRPDDAVWLARQMLPSLNSRRSQPLTGLSAAAEEAIRAHSWPGNGRELRARMTRAVEAASGQVVLPSDMFPERAAETVRPLAEARDRAERAEIVAALERTGGQVGEAARLLHVSRTTLWEKMQKLGL
jgi:DNA-binding NtrC family response regulator